MKRESPVLCVDVAVITTEKPTLILLIRRAHDPDGGKLALPGGHMEKNDLSVAAAASRELIEETWLRVGYGRLKFLTFLDAPNRDPRERIISVVFTVNAAPHLLHKCRAQSDAAEIVIRDLLSIKPEEMALDHYKVSELLRHGGGK